MKKFSLLTTAVLTAGALISPGITAQAALSGSSRFISSRADSSTIISYHSSCDLSPLLEQLKDCFPWLSPSIPKPELPPENSPEQQTPEENLPEQETPEGNLPEQQNPEGNLPGQQNPEGNPPGQQNPEGNLPEQQTPGESLPEQQNPEGNLPGQQNPEENPPEQQNPEGNLPESFPENQTPDNSLPDSDKPEEDSNASEENESLSYAEQVVRLVNAERAKANLSPLRISKEAAAAAQVRAREIEISFSHTRPNGSSFSTALKEQNLSYRSAGENIAWGQRSPKEVVNAWMNSPGHRANILSSSFTQIGVGYYQNASGIRYWSQLFLG